MTRPGRVLTCACPDTATPGFCHMYTLAMYTAPDGGGSGGGLSWKESQSAEEKNVSAPLGFFLEPWLLQCHY